MLGIGHPLLRKPSLLLIVLDWDLLNRELLPDFLDLLLHLLRYRFNKEILFGLDIRFKLLHPGPQFLIVQSPLRPELAQVAHQGREHLRVYSICPPLL
jgi:hypothetical protein